MTNAIPPFNIGPFINIQINSIITAIVEQVFSNTDYLLSFRGQTFTFKSKTPLETGQNLLLRIKHNTGTETELEIVHASKQTNRESIFKPVELRKILQELNLPTDKNYLRVLSEFIKIKAPIEREMLITVNNIAKDETQVKSAAFLIANDINPTEESIKILSKVYQPDTESMVEIFAESKKVGEAVSAFLRNITLNSKNLSPNKIHDAFRSLQSAGPSPSQIINSLEETINNNPALHNLEKLLNEIENNETSKASQKAKNENVQSELSILVKKLASGESNDKPIKEFLKKHQELYQTARNLIIEEAITIFKNTNKQLSVIESDIIDKYSAFNVINNLSLIKGENIYVLDIPLKIGEKLETVRLQINPDEKRGSSNEKGAGLMLGINMSKIGKVTARAYLRSKSVNITFNVPNDQIKRLFKSNSNELKNSLEKEGLDAAIKVTSFDKSEENQSSYYQIDFTA